MVRHWKDKTPSPSAIPGCIAGRSLSQNTLLVVRPAHGAPAGYVLCTALPRCPCTRCIAASPQPQGLVFFSCSKGPPFPSLSYGLDANRWTNPAPFPLCPQFFMEDGAWLSWRPNVIPYPAFRSSDLQPFSWFLHFPRLSCDSR